MAVYPILFQADGPDWDRVPAVELRHTGWVEPCNIAGWAQLCHDGENLHVRMVAEEKNIRATLTGRLDQICDDSCLEFFFAPLEEDERYFNFEVNPLGNLYVGFGGKRPTRVRQIVKKPEELFQTRPFRTQKGWGVTYRVPFTFLRMYMPEFQPEGHCCGNFYKCGDKTEIIHYLAWSPLHCETPDFHRRQDFGDLCFYAKNDR